MMDQWTMNKESETNNERQRDGKSTTITVGERKR
jgi:hypothetical protein